MPRYSIVLRTRKYIKEYRCLSFARNSYNKYRKNFLDTATKTELVLKTATKNVVHKAAEATGEFIGTKISNKIVKPNLCLI